MKSWPSNPYFNVATIRNADMFFGRTRLLRCFYEALVKRQSVSLVGPHNIGKSSLLRCACLPEVQARFEFDLSRHVMVFLDLREYLQKNGADFFGAVCKHIIAQSRGLLALQSSGSSEDEFSHILDQIAEQDLYPVLLMDAFDNITRNKHFGPEFLSFLRAQASMGKVSYVTASITPLYEVCHRGIADSPFFNIFYTYALESLTEEEARELITAPAERVGVLFTEAETEWVLALAGRHPFFIQRVCHFLFEEKLQQNNGKIDERRVRNQAYRDLLPHFKDMWERLSKTQQVLLQDEAQQKGIQQRELPELSASAFFRLFVRDTCKVGIFQMTPEELDNALDSIDDPKALGESNLRLMGIISKRLKREAEQATPPSTVEKGMAIREVLNEAFERLRGSGVRADSASEWKYYNILYYRYFKYHMKNDQIAARLEFTSPRQYFRERRKAIEALLNILLKMEVSSRRDEQE